MVPLESNDALVVDDAKRLRREELRQELADIETAAEEVHQQASFASAAATKEGAISKANKLRHDARGALAAIEGRRQAFHESLRDAEDLDLENELAMRLDNLRTLERKSQRLLEKAKASLEKAEETATTVRTVQTKALQLVSYTNNVDKIEVPAKVDRGADAIRFFDLKGALIPIICEESKFNQSATYSVETSKASIARLVGQQLDLFHDAAKLCAISMRSGGSPVQVAWFCSFSIEAPLFTLDDDGFRISKVPRILHEMRDGQRLQCLVKFSGSRDVWPAAFSLVPSSEGEGFLRLSLTKRDREEARENVAKAERTGPTAGVSSQLTGAFSSAELAKLREKARDLKKKPETRKSVQDELRKFLNAAVRYRESELLKAALERVVAEIAKEARNRASGANASLARKREEAEACKKRGGKDVNEKLRALKRDAERFKDQAERYSKLRHKLEHESQGDRIQLWKNLTLEMTDTHFGATVDNRMLCWIVNGKFLDDLIDAARAPEPQQKVPKERPLQLERVIFRPNQDRAAASKSRPRSNGRHP